MVAQLYADSFHGAFGQADNLAFRFCEWADQEAEMLAEVLPLAKHVQVLNMHGNPLIGASGLNAIAAVISTGLVPSLQKFVFDREWGSRAILLRAACHEKGVTVVTDQKLQLSKRIRARSASASTRETASTREAIGEVNDQHRMFT